MCEETREPLLLHTLQAHRGEVSCADACGALLATGGGDGELRLWRWRRGAGWVEAGAAPHAHRYGVTATRWAASGALLASAGVDGAARVWVVRGGLVARRALVAPGATAARALCWAATRLLVGHDDGALCVWAVPRGTLLARLVPCDGALHALTTLARDSMLLVACTSGTLKIFDLDEVYSSGMSRREAPSPLLWEDGAHDLGALCAAASAEGAAATGGHDARIRLWAASGRREVRAAGELRGHTAAVTALRWARSGTLLASGALDRTARLWAPQARTCLRVLHAHARYLTAVVLAPDQRYLLTGSNDRTVRTWSLNEFSLEEDIEPPCSVLSHFGLGDLEGIQPIEDEDVYEDGIISGTIKGEDSEFNEAERVWESKDAHVGAINSIATYNDLLVTACSDGAVRLFRWSEPLQTLSCERVLAAHSYPAMAVDFGAGGALLLSAGLDGRARLWDVQSGVELLSLSGESVGVGGTGGGGVRGARVSPHRPPLLLLATDDGAVAVWGIEQASSEPLHVYETFAEAATCCAWGGGGRVCAAGGGAGELRALAAPPRARTLHALPAAHDLGVLSCDFAPNGNEKDSNTYLLASAGRDALVKIWKIQVEDDLYGEPSAVMSLLSCVEAHGGAVESVRWAAAAGADGAARLATSGADGWARAWRVSAAGRAAARAGVPAGAGGGATAAALLGRSLLAAGALAGQLALWRLPDDTDDGCDDTEGAEPRHWGVAGVTRWLKEYVTRVPGSSVSPQLEAALLQRARSAELRGPRLMDDGVEDLLRLLLPLSNDLENKENAETEDKTENKDDGVATETIDQLHRRLRTELEWLRREPPSPELEARAPHALRCALSHAALHEPARAADGFSYERANILDYFFAADGAISPLTGRRLRSARVSPNYGLRQQLREFLGWKPSHQSTSETTK